MQEGFVGLLIGKQGKRIKDVQDRTHTQIHVQDSGVVTIVGLNPQNVAEATDQMSYDQTITETDSRAGRVLLWSRECATDAHTHRLWVCSCESGAKKSSRRA